MHRKLCGESRDGLRHYLTTLSPMTLPQNLLRCEGNRQGIPRTQLYSLFSCQCCYAFSYCSDEDFSGKYCGVNDGSMMENLSEQCIITEYAYVCRNYLSFLQDIHPSLLNVHEPYNSTCENSSESVSKLGFENENV